MSKELDYKKIEESIKKVPCPVCGIFPESIIVKSNFIGATVNCGHDGFLSLIDKKIIQLKKEQMGIID